MEFYDEFNQAERQQFITTIKNLEFDYNSDITQYFSKENETNY